MCNEADNAALFRFPQRRHKNGCEIIDASQEPKAMRVPSPHKRTVDLN